MNKQSLTFNPTGAETGTVVLNQTNPSTITLGQFTIPSPPLPTPYVSSAGGVEQFIYDGQTGGSSLKVNTPLLGANTDTYTPGATPDAGSFQISNTISGGLLPISYSNLGPGGAGAASRWPTPVTRASTR